MAKADADLKALLKGSGLWGEFLRYRDELRRGGFSPAESNEQAEARYRPMVAGLGGSEGISPGGVLPEPARCPESGEGRPASLDVVGVYRELLERDADVLTVISWVAKNLDVPEAAIRKEDAPSAEAWGMLWSYRRSDVRKDEFWDKVYVKLIPSKSQLDSTTRHVVDGVQIQEACSRLLRLKEEAEGGD